MFQYLFAATALLSLSSAQLQTFLTRPGQQAIALDIKINNSPEKQDPGYIFVAPYNDTDTAFLGGPHIFQSDGTLVWKGLDTVEHRAMDLHVCDYLGYSGDHLCFNDGDQKALGGYTAGVIKFLDKTYTPVGGSFDAVNHLEGPDLHELNTPIGYNGQIFLQDIYHAVQTDLSSVGGAKDGFAISGCFQEMDIATRNETFQWCSLDYVPLTESTLALDPKADTKKSSYDYFHLNAVDKDENGDYLVSSRHCDTLYKVAGMKSSKPGEILWRLGGKTSSFAAQGTFNFSRQHMGRFKAPKTRSPPSPSLTTAPTAA